MMGPANGRFYNGVVPPDPTPPTPGVVSEVERRRVLRLLDESRSSTVVVLSAPAGSGKSTVAQQWVTRDARSHVTVRLAEHLDDPAALSEHIIDALECFGAPAPETRSRITGKEPVFSATLLPALNRLSQSRAEPFILVLDDVHLLHSTAAHRVIEAVCEGTPSGSTIILLTRSLTPAWLARVRATGRLTELSATELDFDVEESATLVEGMGLHLDRAEVAAIVDHTEGWAVGVYLTALSMRPNGRTTSNEARVARGSDRIVSDYLRTQVLDSVDEDRRRFLTLTSILEELNGPVCDAVLEREDSAAVLAELHQRIQLVIAIDPDERRFRLHHLLAEELTADLQRLEPARVTGLHERACLWFEAHGDTDAAIRHAIASGDMGLASRMIWPEVAGCVASGRLDRLRSWLVGLSDRQLAGDRWLSMAAVWASLQQGDAVAMGRWARIAERHAGPDWRQEARHDRYAATVAVLHALLGSGGLDDTRDLCERALQGLAPDDLFRASAASNLGIAQTLQRDLEGGRASLIEAASLARSLGVPIVEVNATSWLGLLALAEGERERGIRLITEATDVIRRNHLDRLATGALSMTAQALVLALLGDKSTASTTLATARRLSGLLGDVAPWFAVTGRLIQARTAILVGDGATARLLIAEAKAHMTPELSSSSAADSLAEAEEFLARMSALGGPAGALTTAELRVLQFLPSHLTLQQIGEHLFVSQSTVKTHVLSIYRKLGVGSRSEAVAHARALGLVESPIAD